MIMSNFLWPCFNHMELVQLIVFLHNSQIVDRWMSIHFQNRLQNRVKHGKSGKKNNRSSGLGTGQKHTRTHTDTHTHTRKMKKKKTKQKTQQKSRETKKRREGRNGRNAVQRWICCRRCYCCYGCRVAVSSSDSEAEEFQVCARFQHPSRTANPPARRLVGPSPSTVEPTKRRNKKQKKMK